VPDGPGRLQRGEGVSGLARAFLLAGSRSAVCSLWNVSDSDATVSLMADVYHGLKGSQSAPVALRAVQRARIAAGSPPYLWAPFIIMGR
jgi:CHAT domain-containing protein